MTPQEALAKALLPILKAGSYRGYWSSDDPYMHPMDWNAEAASLFSDALIPALTSVGYALVPVKEALTVERIAAALRTAEWNAFGRTPPDDWTTRMAAALLAALETSEVTK